MEDIRNGYIKSDKKEKDSVFCIPTSQKIAFVFLVDLKQCRVTYPEEKGSNKKNSLQNVRVTSPVFTDRGDKNRKGEVDCA